MSTKPEGFFWWQKGSYDDEKVEQDLREKLPAWYGSHGYIDFQVTGDSIEVDSDHRQGDPAPCDGRRAALPGGPVRHRRATGGSPPRS